MDPHQTQNLFGTPAKINGYPMEKVVTRLDALLMVLKSCKGQQCTRPWLTLHPNGVVNNLGQALHSRLDRYYENQPKITFSECAPGYYPWAEGPMEVSSFYVPD